MNKFGENTVRNRAPRPPIGRQGGPGGPVTGEKAKDFKKSWGKLINYCRKYLAVLIIALAAAIIGSVLTIIGPVKIKELTNLILEGAFAAGGINAALVVKICVTLIVLYVSGAVFSYMQGFIMATVTQRVCKKLRSDISVKINKLPLKYFDSTSFGDTLSRVTNDVDIIEQTLIRSVGTLVSAVALFVGSLVMMLVTNWIMGLAAIGATLVGFIFMLIVITKSQKHFLQQQQELGNINGQIEEVYSGHNVVKAYNGEKYESERFEAINEKLYGSSWKSQFLSGIMMPVMSFVGNLGFVTVCVLGGVMAFKGSISFGVVVAFMMYVRLFTQPLTQMAQAASSLQSTAAASERVFEFLGQQEMEDESGKAVRLETAKGEVDFCNLHFGYDENKTVINNFSAHTAAGHKVAIVGPTGAGKTTIVNLLMRFYELKSGKILIDGVDISTLKRENVHDLFCMVLQDTWLFEGTIKDNIIYSKRDVSDEDVINACKAVGIDHFIRTLSKGYDTVLDDKANLSAGQKQLITIARAMVENAPLLILDEATSSVDTRTEVLIQEAMDKLTKGRTSFVIAHRLSTIKNADMILVLKDGDIIESGSHAELLSDGGFYAELYNSQFESA